MTVLLGWGERPRECPTPDRVRLRVLSPPRPHAAVDVRAALDAALAHPVGARPLATVATARSRVVVVVSGPSAAEPRAELFAAARRALAAVPDDRLTIAVANGARAPVAPERLGLPEDVLRRHRVVNHDARDAGACVEMGRTSRGTRLRVNRCVAEADLVVATGGVRPDARAGFGGGAEGIFPGLAFEDDARAALALAVDAGPLLGRADGNPFRDDLEEAVRRLGRDTYLVGVALAGGAALGAVAGDLVLAHREAVRTARPACEVDAEPADAVVVSAPLPVAASLEAASPLVAPAGLLLRDGGAVILAVECSDGVGAPAGLDPALSRHLPPRHRLFLVSSLDAGTVAPTWATWAPGVAWALERAREAAGVDVLDALVLPDGGDLVPARRRSVP